MQRMCVIHIFSIKYKVSKIGYNKIADVPIKVNMYTSKLDSTLSVL